MANNRAYLVCMNCLINPEQKELWGDNGCLIMLFKYYPSTGWYINVDNTMEAKTKFVDDTNSFLDKHKHPSMYGEHIIILFEGQLNDDFVSSKKNIMEKLDEVMYKLQGQNDNESR